MAYPFLILVALLVVALGVFYWLVTRGGDNERPHPPRKATSRPRKQAPKSAANKGAPPLPEPGPAGSYTAVSITGGSCKTAWDVEGRRFLTKDAPKLPLQGCDADQCTCKYEHHKDRRENHGDRRSPSGLQSQLYGSTGDNEERRTRRGRRKEDFS